MPQNIIFLLLLVTIILYSQTVDSLYYLWIESGNPAYSHGSLAFLIAMYIFGKFWFFKSSKPVHGTQATESLAPVYPVKLDVIGLCLLFAACFLWLFADLGNIQVLQQFALLGIVGFLFWSCFGYEVFKKLSIPLFIMVSTIPLWDFMDFYLQHITAVGVSSLLGITTIPYLKEGIQILLQSGTFEIADRCSGLRMVTAIVPVALLYAYQWKFRAWVTACYVLLSILVAIFANVIRILIVVIAGHLTEMKHYFVTTDHVTLGWIVFGVIVLIFIYLSNKLLINERWYSRIAVSENNISDSTRFGLEESGPKRSFSKSIHVFIISGVVILAGPVFAKVVSSSQAEAVIDPIELSTSYGKWNVVPVLSGAWQPEFQGEDFEIRQKFTNSERGKIELYLAHYHKQEQGKEAVHFENKPYDPEKWHKISETKVDKELPGSGKLPLVKHRIKALTGQQKLIWQWYYVAGKRSNSKLNTKLLEIVGKVTGRPAISVIMLATDISDTEELAVNSLEEFAKVALPSIENSLDSIIWN